MSTICVKMKWNKQVFDLEIDLTQSVEVLKTQIWTLTSVPLERQKLMGIAGGPLKDGENLAARKWKEGQQVMLIGTAEGQEAQGPKEQTKFVEDLTDAEYVKLMKDKKHIIAPAGLLNLGNTCYMNSVIEALNAIPEFRELITRYTPSGGDGDAALTVQLSALTKQINSTTDAVTPAMFVMIMKQRFPQFAETTEQGAPKQQDAEEFLTGLLQVLSHTLPAPNGNQIDNMFGYTMKSRLKCVECDEEEATETEEHKRVLLCHMGTPTEPVSLLHQGVGLSFKEHIEKRSENLARNAQYEKTSAMASIPPYLIIQFARFSWKEKNDSAGTGASKTKVTRKVSFPRKLDVFDFASEQLKKELIVGRRRRKDIDDVEFENMGKEKKKGDEDAEMTDVDAPAAASAAPAATSAAAPAEAAAPEGGAGGMEVDQSGDAETLEIDARPEVATGEYELVSVVSHQGRSADGGHYIAWSFQATEEDEKTGKKKDDVWAKFDDDQVSIVNTKHSSFTDLHGGKADSQIAYFSFYRKLTIRNLTDSEKKQVAVIRGREALENKNLDKKPGAK